MSWPAVRSRCQVGWSLSLTVSLHMYLRSLGLKCKKGVYKHLFEGRKSFSSEEGRRGGPRGAERRSARAGPHRVIQVRPARLRAQKRPHAISPAIDPPATHRMMVPTHRIICERSEPACLRQCLCMRARARLNYTRAMQLTRAPCQPLCRRLVSVLPTRSVKYGSV